MRPVPATLRQADDVADRRSEPTPDVASFLDRINDEHTRFLDRLIEAQRLLDPPSGSLPSAGALQVRLTQQFLDAQRAILRRRADADAEVARIDRPVVPAAGRHPEPDELVALATRRSALMERQLRSLLDGWWRSEQEEAVAAVDDANARATVRQLRPEVAHGGWPPPAVTVPGGEAGVSLSCAALELELADHLHLERVLGSLLESLDQEPVTVEQVAVEQVAVAPVAVEPVMVPPTVGAPWPRPMGEPVVAGDAVTPLPALLGPPGRREREEAFDRFWGDGSRPVAAGPVRRWVALQVVPPLVTLVAVLVVVLAWMG